MCVVLVGGCVKSGIQISYDDPLEGKLDYLVDHQESARLSDLTDFSWDEVHLFNEWDSREKVEQVVGAPVRMSSSLWGGSLLIFEENGKPVRAVGVTGGYLRADHRSWRSDVLLKPWGAGALRLTLPPAGEQRPPGNAE